MFGQVLVEAATAPQTGTIAMMRPSLVGSFRYSQMEFQMFTGGVYAFRKHRIETTFRPGGAGGMAAGDTLNILTDGGVTNWLMFDSTGKVYLSSNVMAHNTPWGDRVESQSQQVATFNASQPVHLVWETDIDGGSTTVTVNGQTTTVSGLSPMVYGLRNWQAYPGPLSLRMNFASNSTTSSLALSSVKITGDDYDGPIYVDPGGPITENDVTTVPFEAPTTGTWQPQFSLDGLQWKSYGETVSAGFPFGSISFGTQVSSTMLFRLKRVPE